MGDAQILALGIRDRLRQLQPAGTLLLMGELPVLRELTTLLDDDVRGRAVLVSPGRHRRLRRMLGSLQPTLLRADPLDLPLAPASLQVVVAVRILDRMVDWAGALAGWSRLLRAPGHLVLADRLSPSPTVRLLTRARHAPEELTGAMLNAGFVDIRQSWTRPHGGTVITTGELLEL